jgi:aminoglycoside phosphotransferase (APT) family kinase protein
MDDLSPILQRIPQFSNSQSLEVEELTGGITNKNYKICTDTECYVLRMGGNETRYLGIDRKTEHECSYLAAQTGIAPRPTAFLEPEGYILSEFISGKSIPAEENRNTARKFKVQLPDMIDWYLDTSHEIEKAMYGREPLVARPCHNDLLNGNFIDDGNRIRILDWEYAGMGDIFFDLGNFAVQHEFNDEQDEMLMRTYFTTPTDSQRAHQKLMKIMSDLREAMWAQVQLGVSQLDFDYAGYGQKYFERFESSTCSSEYSDWLEAV